MSAPSPVIILVAPQMGENIGAAARAMLNFGLTELRIVNPRDGWPNPKAIEMATGAFDFMPPVQVFESLTGAIADLHFTYGATARPRDMTKPVFTAKTAIQDAAKRAHADHKIGLVFGPERAGLDNDDLSHCHAALQIPTNPDFSSLNLAQAVLLLAYEWRRIHDETPDRTVPMGSSFPAQREKLDEFIARLENELDAGGFFRDEGPRPAMVRNLRNMFLRSELSDQELRTLHGVVSTLLNKDSK